MPTGSGSAAGERAATLGLERELGDHEGLVSSRETLRDHHHG